MARYRRKDSGPGSWLVIIILISVFSGLAEFVLGSAFGLLGLFFEVIVPLLMFAGILFAPLIFIGIGIKIIVDAIKKHRGVSTSKTVSSTATPTVSHKRLLKQINKFFDKNQQLNIDEETYLLLTDRNNVSLETIDIYMREEYIGTLKDYFNAYPNSFNSLSNLISKYLNAKNLNEKQVVEEIKRKLPEPLKRTVLSILKNYHSLKMELKTSRLPRDWKKQFII